jgi:hypothetical protein
VFVRNDFAITVITLVTVDRFDIGFAVARTDATGIGVVEIIPVDRITIARTIDITAVDIGTVGVVPIGFTIDIEVFAAHKYE